MKTLFVLLTLVIVTMANAAPGGGGGSFPFTRYDFINGKRYIASGNGTNWTFRTLIYAGDSNAGVITNNSGNLTGKTVTMTTTVTATSGNPEFVFWGQNTIANPGNTPANYRMFFSNIVPPYNHAPTCGNCYWFSHQAVGYIGIGTTNLNEDFNPAHWSNSYGLWATNNLVDFNVALSNVKQLGLMFGGGSFFDVGVGVKPNTGSATFQLNSFTIQ